MASTHGTWNQGNLNWKKCDCFAERVKHHELKSYQPRFDRKWFCLRNVTASTWRLNWPFEKCSSDYRGEFEDRDSHGTGVGVFIFIHFNGCVFVCIWFLLFHFVVAFFDELYWLRVPRVCPKVEKRKTKHTHTHLERESKFRFYSFEISSLCFFSFFLVQSFRLLSKCIEIII